MTKKQIFANNFLGGVAWGFGSAIGAVILFTILGFILAKINLLPFIGSFVAQIQQVAKQQQINSPKPTGY